MKCPYCSSEMTKGYIEQGRGRLIWQPCYPKGDGLFARKKESLKLARPFVFAEVIVHRCEKCRKLVIDEKELDV